MLAETGAAPIFAGPAGTTAPIAAIPPPAMPGASPGTGTAFRARMTDESAPTWVKPATAIGVSELLARFDTRFVMSPGCRPSAFAMSGNIELSGVACTGDARLRKPHEQV